MMFKNLHDKFVLKVKWMFHYLGFIIEKIPDENKIFSDLKNTHEAVQKHVLKRLTKNIRIANNHVLYNNLLKKCVPDWNSDFTSAMFIGNGVGEFSLDTFRKVYLGENLFFEKVYFNDTYDMLKVEWFYEHIFPLLNDSLNVPRIYRITKGDLITIVYFEFAELIPLPNSKLDYVSFAVSKRLIEISKTAVVQEISEAIPEYLRNYKLHAFYKANIVRASKLIKILSDNKLTSDMIEHVVNQQSPVLTHGDIQETNLFANNYLIDWDSFGFFPLGFEIAYILYQCDFRNGVVSYTFEDLQEILVANYKTIIDRDYWIFFELTCFYFYFIFTALHEDASPTALQKDVVSRIQEMYQEALNAKVISSL